MEEVVEKYGDLVDDHNKLVRKYNKLAEMFHTVADGFKELETENAKNIADYNELNAVRNKLAADFNALVAAIAATGLYPVESKDGFELVIAESDKASASFKEAKAKYYDDWFWRAAAGFVGLPPSATREEIMARYPEEEFQRERDSARRSPTQRQNRRKKKGSAGTLS